MQEVTTFIASLRSGFLIANITDADYTGSATYADRCRIELDSYLDNDHRTTGGDPKLGILLIKKPTKSKTSAGDGYRDEVYTIPAIFQYDSADNIGAVTTTYNEILAEFERVVEALDKAGDNLYLIEYEYSHVPMDVTDILFTIKKYAQVI